MYLEVAAHEDEEGDSVDEHEEDDVSLADRVAHLKRQADGELAVIGDADQRQQGHDEGEEPADGHDVRSVAQRESLVEVHGVSYGVVAFHGDDGQCVDGQLWAEHTEETGHLASGGELPRDGVHAEFAQGGRVDDGQESQVDAHEEVGHAQVAHQEARNVHFGTGEDEDEDDGSVAQQRHQEDEPHSAPERPPIKQVLARHEGAWHPTKMFVNESVTQLILCLVLQDIVRCCKANYSSSDIPPGQFTNS